MIQISIICIFPAHFSGVSCDTTSSHITSCFLLFTITKTEVSAVLIKTQCKQKMRTRQSMSDSLQIRGGDVAERAADWNSEDRSSTSRLDSPFYSATQGPFPNQADSVFIAVNWQSGKFSTRRLFRSHQKPTLLANYYFGNEALSGIVFVHYPEAIPILQLALFWFCEGQSDINICENTL